MADVKFQRGTESKINSATKVDGTISFATDTKKIFLDTSSTTRIEFGGSGGLSVYPCTISNSLIRFGMDKDPDNGTIILGLVTSQTGTLANGSKSVESLTISDTGSGTTLNCSYYTMQNYTQYTVFAIYKASGTSIINLGSLNSIDDEKPMFVVG